MFAVVHTCRQLLARLLLDAAFELLQHPNLPQLLWRQLVPQDARGLGDLGVGVDDLSSEQEQACP